MNKLLKGKKFWNSISFEYSSDRTKGRKFIIDPALFELIGSVRRKKVLDVACGAGDISIALAQKGVTCTGIDFSENLIQQAKNKAAQLRLKINFIVGDVRNLNGELGNFDLVVVALLFPHFSSLKDIKKTIKNIAQVIKPQGRLIIAEPHPTFDFYMRNNLKNNNFNYLQSGLPYQFTMNIGDQVLQSEAYHWTLQDYSQALEEGGFLIKRIVEPKPLTEGAKIDQEWYKERSRYPSYILFDCQKL